MIKDMVNPICIKAYDYIHECTNLPVPMKISSIGTSSY